MIRTIKNINNDLETFCDNHLQIKEFGWGNISNITTKDHDFVMLWLQPIGSIIEGNLLTLRYDMYIMDLVKQDNSNLEDVHNDTFLIGLDVVNKFWSDEETYGWTINENTVTSEPFEAKFDDYTSGHIFSIEIEVENRMSNCNIPEE